jgi:Ca2+-transporting ATPase
MNQMTVQETWFSCENEHTFCEVMGLGCETDAYDPWRKAMLQYCEKLGISKDQLLFGTLVCEYPFTNDLKMMGHVWNQDGKIIIAAKGFPRTYYDHM